ncbi:MAG: haloacid dehalogenase type II [Acidobacteria bacterium]|nr:MAG: haloacid dehalogenase type II [Acidobacteriota bacterium]
MDLTQFKFLSFDCYGTLIDWETGILASLRSVLKNHNKTLTDAEILNLYAELESAIESGEFKPYREVLKEVVRGFAARLGFKVTEQEANSLPDSLKDWCPFPDTVAALKSLARHYKLCVISNIDDDLFAHSARRLEVPFHVVVTALEARSYKPSHNNFHLALTKIGAPREQVLHVAESLFHDVAPARALGIKSVWVDRSKGKRGRASRTADVKPDLEVPDLKTLAELVERSFNSPPRH